MAGASVEIKRFLEWAETDAAGPGANTAPLACCDAEGQPK